MHSRSGGLLCAPPLPAAAFALQQLSAVLKQNCIMQTLAHAVQGWAISGNLRTQAAHERLSTFLGFDSRWRSLFGECERSFALRAWYNDKQPRQEPVVTGGIRNVGVRSQGVQRIYHYDTEQDRHM